MLTVALALCLHSDQPRTIQAAPAEAPVIYVMPQANPWNGKKIAGLTLTLMGGTAFIAGAGIALWGLSVMASNTDGFWNALAGAAIWYIATWTGGITAAAGLGMLIPGAVLLGTSTPKPAQAFTPPAKQPFSASYGFAF